VLKEEAKVDDVGSSCEWRAGGETPQQEFGLKEEAKVDDVGSSCEWRAGGEIPQQGAENQHVDEKLGETANYGKGVLEGLRGKPKADAVINLLLNRTCTREDYRATLDSLRKYFEDDVDKLANFLGMKFGTGWKSWEEAVSTLSVEIAGDDKWDPGLTLGMVMAELRRKKSECVSHGMGQATQRTQRLNQPRKSKVKRQK